MILKKAERGFTLIELMIVVTIIGLLATVALPTLTRYVRKARTIEAISGLEKMKIGAKTYYQSDHYASDNTLQPKSFPATQALRPAGSFPCCASTTRPKCGATASSWQTATWNQLQFQMTEPHYDQYSFTSSGSELNAVYTAAAVGDLDCDTIDSIYSSIGLIDQESGVSSPLPLVLNDAE